MLTPTDVARRCRVARSKVTKAIRAGELPAVDLGSPGRHCYRVAPEDMDEWLAGRRVQPAGVPAAPMNRLGLAELERERRRR